jgi:hypothetical protein
MHGLVVVAEQQRMQVQPWSTESTSSEIFNGVNVTQTAAQNAVYICKQLMITYNFTRFGAVSKQP